jgi:hypothetical protein
MTEDNKFYLPHVLNGMMTKLSALFFQKLILFDNEVLESKNLRHYDFECEGLMGLVNFCERRINKNQIYAFQTLKNTGLSLSDVEFVRGDGMKDLTPKKTLNRISDSNTPRTKFLSRVNTTF